MDLVDRLNGAYNRTTVFFKIHFCQNVRQVMGNIADCTGHKVGCELSQGYVSL
jgi:hypothetical protein